MIHLRVTTDFARMQRILDDVSRQQLPFAAARALTTVAKTAQREATDELPSAFDRPTPFTRRAVGVTSATKATLEAVVFVRPIQAQYLGLAETGGTQEPKKAALVTPVAQRLNQYGNIPNRALARAKARKNVFVGQVRGVGGFWQRTKDGLKLLARFDASRKVAKNAWFIPAVTRVVERDFGRALREALADALRTARRR